MKKSICLLIVFFILFPTLKISAQDWPQFGGTARDNKVTGFKVPKAWPDSLEKIWSVKVGTGDATPALVKGKLYLNTRQGDNEVIMCLDASTGKEIWRDQYPSPAVTGPAGSHPGPRSTPAVTDGKVITYGAAGILSCLEAGSGKVLWRKDNPEKLWPQFFTGMSPLIAGPNLCAVHTGTKDKGEVALIDINNGSEKWKWAGDGPSYSSPALMKINGKPALIVVTEKNMVALDLLKGNVLWQVPMPVQQRFYNCVSPYINGDIIYLSGQGTGTKAFKVTETGATEIWSNTEAGAKWNTPVLNNGFLYGFTDQKRVYCINAETGSTAWIDNTVNSDFATMSDCGQVLFGMSSTGNLLVIKPDPAGYSQVAKYKVTNTPVYSFPLIAGNNIYIKDAENLILFRIK